MTKTLQISQIKISPPSAWRRQLGRLSGGASDSIVPRLAGYALLAFVLWLMVSTLVMPLVSSRATRTVLQAPVVLITSPISGVVTRMSAHPLESIEPGAVVATVQNPTLNREILTTLTTQRLALRGQVLQLDNLFSAYTEELKFVEQQVNLYRKASMAQTRDAYQIAQRQREVALTAVAEQELKVRHTSALLDEGAISPQAMDAAQAQLRTSRASAGVAEQAYAGLGQVVASASQGAFVGSSNGNVYQTLVSRRETLLRSIERAQRDSAALNEQLQQVTALEEAERRRVEKLAAYEVKAMQGGQVRTVLLAEGTFVPEGATLVRMTDCSRLQVVAVFTARLAKRLNIGSMLDVTLNDASASLPARVTQLLPVASEEVQSSYSVPFPYAEQGSVYAVAQIEGRGAEPSIQRHLCSPGKVVTAELRS
ncbi:HlyD family efflux transporter periplasmic adaptor subunit [Variovorax sp. ZT5P49]|uniref:HlyD family efflux transporter periplasmic adaptor subunit n=1 Tax=Variovorax sp. ZT5P49 TaxID=3443733 RepID=UPI003F457266